MASQKYARIFGKCHKKKQQHANDIILGTTASNKTIQGSMKNVPQINNDKQKPSQNNLHTIRLFPKQNSDGKKRSRNRHPKHIHKEYTVINSTYGMQENVSHDFAVEGP